jgi:uncharacterized protein YcfL
MKTKLAALLTAVLTVAGCHTTPVNSVENAQKSGQRYMIPDQRVVTDMSLNHKVSVVGVNTAMTAGNVLKVQVELLNESRKLQRFAYTFEWFDDKGMQINNVTSATIADQIDGRESKFISAVAPTPACTDFRLKLIKVN